MLKDKKIKKRKKRAKIALLLIFFCLFALSISFIFRDHEKIKKTPSIELTLNSFSPKGLGGGAMIPASCESAPPYEHFPGECAVNGVCGSEINACDSGNLGENHYMQNGIWHWFCMGINGGSNSDTCVHCDSDCAFFSENYCSGDTYTGNCGQSCLSTRNCCASNQGDSCGSCGGTVQCDGGCSVSTPSNYGDSCGSCGGTVQCDGGCSVSTPSNYGDSCGSCGGTVQCDGGCSVSTPGNYGDTCYAYSDCSYNTGSIQCDGYCDASAPGNPSGYGDTCYVFNDCIDYNTGSVQCNGSCSASAPANVRDCGDTATVCEGTYYSDLCEPNKCLGTGICPPTVTLIATDEHISMAEVDPKSTLIWTVADASFCWFWLGENIQEDRDRGRRIDPVSANDTVRPKSTTRYNIQCWNDYDRSDGVRSVEICVSDCACADGVCTTRTCSECGFTCTGEILPNTCGPWMSGGVENGCSKSCGKGIQTRECNCPPETETQTCNAKPCPPGYREVAP